ncbi:hypothetical protein KDA14_02935 [Candidatus Saccharibacteria bacterium]|nr:hypothetical protein [Candidatus Saccharibacteria bacterium]
MQQIIRYRIDSTFQNEHAGNGLTNEIEKRLKLYFEKRGIHYKPYPISELGLGAGGAGTLILRVLKHAFAIVKKSINYSQAKSLKEFTPTYIIDLGLLIEDTLTQHDEREPGREVSKLLIIGDGFIEQLKPDFPDTNFQLTARLRYAHYSYNLVVHYDYAVSNKKHIASAVHFLKPARLKGNAYETISIDESPIIRHRKYLFNYRHRVWRMSSYRYFKFDKIVNGKNRGIKLSEGELVKMYEKIDRKKRDSRHFVGLSGLYDTHIKF